MKRTDNIEELFKETFDQFEADINPNVWNSIQGKMNSGSGTSSSQIGAKTGLGAAKIISGIAAVGLILGAVWFFSNQDANSSTNNKDKSETAQKTITDKADNLSVNNFSSSDEEAKTTASNPNPASPQNNKSVSANEKTITSSAENNISDNSEINAATQPENTQQGHKYGKAPSGPSSLVRGSQANNSDSQNAKSSKGNNASETQQEEALPTAMIYASTVSGDAPLTVSFSNQGIASSTRWDFGDGTASSESSTEHTFSKAGTYVVYLNVRNSSSVQVTDKVSIEVKSVSDIGTIPNIFTPNGDGLNDRFLFELKNIASINSVIYLKGQPVYKWNNLEGGWDGKTFTGTDAPEGTYFYEIKAVGIDGIPHSKNGFIHLSRKDK